MSQLIEAQVRTVRIYGCGGTGVNVLRRYRESKNLDADNIRSTEQFTYIDTGIANLLNADTAETYIVKALDPNQEDGAGKNRAAWAKAIKAGLPELLLQHSAGDLNIVLFGTAGGSGSVIGPLLLEQLLADGATAVGVVIGSHDSLKATINTINTLQGLETAVSRLNRPVVIYYQENDPLRTHGENDILPQFVMAALSIFGSGRNAHLDRSDVRNFFDYNKVTHHTPSLAMLDIFARDEDLISKIPHAITYGALLKSQSDLAPRIPNDYDTVGYLPETVQGNGNSLYYTVTTGGLSEIFKGLLEKKAQAEKQKQVSQKTVSLLGNSTGADDLGLILE